MNTPDVIATFLLLIGLELVLGIDNVLVITILVSRLPEKSQNITRIIGLALAMVLRILSLYLVFWLKDMKEALFHLGEFPISVRDVLLMAGGLFLIYKSVHEIHHVVELRSEVHNVKHKGKAKASLLTAIIQIIILDFVFSFDSVLTAVGLTDKFWVIIIAVIVSFAIILYFSKTIGNFILSNPALKILALSFLVTIGVTLFLEGMHQDFSKAFIYLPMGFALIVELLQMRYFKNKKNYSA